MENCVVLLLLLLLWGAGPPHPNRSPSYYEKGAVGTHASVSYPWSGDGEELGKPTSSSASPSPGNNTRGAHHSGNEPERGVVYWLSP